MGKLLTVNAGYSAVLLPSANGYRTYSPGGTAIVTDAEYAVLPLGTLAAVTVTTAGLPDPYRTPADPSAKATLVQAFTAAAGGTLQLGANIVTGPAAGVTYVAGWLTVPPTHLSASLVGPTPGSLSTVELFHVQGAVISVAPTAAGWFDQPSRTDTTTTTSGQSVVLDASITAADLGSTVTGTGIPANSFVGTVVPGVSFVISSSKNTTIAVNASGAGTSVVVQPQVLTKWPAAAVPTFTASVGAVDYFKFETYDGGATWYNLATVKGLA